MNLRDHWKCIVPPGSAGSAKIEGFTVSETDSFMSTLRRSYVPAGDYTRLFVGGALMMSDTPSEFRDHLPFLLNARGDILINGLGLGCCLNVVMHKPEVSSVTVVEKSEDVLTLVSPHFLGVHFVHADALTWRPSKGVKFDAVWHDIWPDICADNLPQMHSLHRAYGRRSDWQGSWSRPQIERLRKERRYY